MVSLSLAIACARNGLDVGQPPLAIVAPRLDAPVVEIMPPASARPVDPVKRAVFDRINRDRVAHGLATVLWDDGASRVADRFCAEQIRENTTGHYLTNGLPPYARTAFAGVFGMQSENSVTWKTTGSSFDDPVESLALEGHEEMIGEKPPYDGHRRTILDPDATHVGVGYAIEGKDFRMAQEFLTRHLAWLKLERIPSSPGLLEVTGMPVEGRRLQFVTIALEPPPERLTREQASGRMSYSYPTPVLAFVREGNVTLKVVGTVTQGRIRFTRDREFSFRFEPDQPGLWTMVFHTAPLRENRPSPGGVAAIQVDRVEPNSLAGGFR